MKGEFVSFGHRSTWRVVHVVTAETGEVGGFSAYRAGARLPTISLPEWVSTIGLAGVRGGFVNVRNRRPLPELVGYATVLGGYEFRNGSIKALVDGPCWYWLTQTVDIGGGHVVPLLVMAREGWRGLLAPTEAPPVGVTQMKAVA